MNAPTAQHDRWLATSNVRTKLKQRSVRAGGHALASQFAKVVIQTGSLAVLARLLSPGDYGLVGMALILVEFVRTFDDGGLASATIRQPDLNQAQVSNTFWINVGFGLLLGVVVAASAPLGAQFFADARLASVISIMAVPVALSGLVVQHQALLRRQMMFGRIAAVDITADLLAALFAIGAAMWGAGYFALVLRQWVQTSVSICGSWIACSWRPSLYVRSQSVRDILRFGGTLTGARFLSYLSRNADNALVGRHLGPEVLGWYTQAYRLLMLPIQRIRGPLEAVTLPGLSSLLSEKDRMRAYYLRFVEILGMITMPLMALGLVFAEEVILLFLGPNWGQAARLFRAFALVGIVIPVMSTRGQLMLACGLVRRHFVWMLTHSLSNVTAFVIGIRWGVEGVVAAYIVVNYALIPFSLFYCFSGTPVTPRAFLVTVSRPLVGALATLAAAYAVKMAAPAGLLGVVAGTASGLAACAATWWFLPGFRGRFQENLLLFRSK